MCSSICTGKQLKVFIVGALLVYPVWLVWNGCLLQLKLVLLWKTKRCCVPGPRLNITAENDCRRLHCSLRDLSSLLQAVGRLAEYFTGDVFAARFNDALTVVER